MSTAKDASLEKILRSNIFLLRINAVMSPTDKSRFKALFPIYAFVAHALFMCVSYVPQFIQTWIFYEDSSQVIYNGQVNIHYVVCLVKCYQFRKAGQIVDKLLHMSADDIFQPKSEVESLALKSRMMYWRRIYIIYISSVIVTLVWMYVNSILFGETPVPSWFPSEWQQSPYYQLSWLHQTIALNLCGLGNSSVDCFLAALMMYTSAQFEMLKLSLRRCFKTNLAETPELRLVDLIKAIKYHQHILIFYNNSQKLFAESTLCQLLSNIFSISSCLYKMHQVPASSPEFSQAFEYMLLVLFELFMYCWLGQFLISESMDFPEALADSIAWYNESADFRRLFLIFLQQSQYPLEIKAGGLATLSRETFLKTIRTSYSYLTLMIQVAD